MKILVVSHTYIAPINREKWLVCAKKYPDIELKVLIPKKWSTTLFDIKAGDLSKYKLKNCEFIAIDTFNTGNEVLYGYKFLKLIKLLRSFKPDLIHIEQGDNAFSFFQLIVLSKIFCRNAKFVFFTWVNWKHKWSLKYKLFWSFIEKFNLKNSKGAIVGNKDAAKILREKKFIKKIKVLLQLGVNKNYFFPAKEIKNTNVFTIGFIGRFVQEKGIFLLLEAFVELKKDFPNWKLVLIGDGKDKKNVIDYVSKNGLNEYVEVLLPVVHEKVGDILNKFDIFVLPSYDTFSWREQFGHVLIEAMACLVPIVASDAGEIPNVIADTGLIFEQKNVRDLINKLKSLMINQKLRNDFALKGYKLFENKFSYDYIADKTYKFWSEIL